MSFIANDFALNTKSEDLGAKVINGHVRSLAPWFKHTGIRICSQEDVV
jgi:hypothetical protein